MSVSLKVKRALPWSFLAEFTVKGSQAFTYFLLMFFLSPVEMGQMASILMVLSFAQVFWEAGLGKELIRREQNIREAANIAFFASLLISVLLYFGIQIMPAAFFFSFLRAETVLPLQISALYLILGSLSSVHIAIMQKELKFDKWFKVKFVGATSTPLLSIPLAYYGFGLWALVFGALFGQFMSFLAAWCFSNWRPQLQFGSFDLARQMLAFCFWVFCSSLLLWLFVWLDTLVVALYFDPETLGLYRSALILTAGGLGLIFAPIVPVLYSALSKSEGKIQKGEIANEFISLLTYISISLSWMLFASGHFIELYLLPEDWDGIGKMFSFLALTYGYAWIANMNGEFYKALGRPGIEALVIVCAVTFYAGGYLLSASHGFDQFLFSRLILTVLFLVFNILVLSRIIKLDLRMIFVRIISATFLCWAVVQIMRRTSHLLASNFWDHILKIIISAAFLALLFALFERKRLLPQLIRRMT